MTERDEAKVERTPEQLKARLRVVAKEAALRRIIELTRMARVYRHAWPPIAKEAIREARFLQRQLKERDATLEH